MSRNDNKDNRFDSYLRSKILAYFKAAGGSGGSNVTEINSAAILAELQAKADAGEDQASLIKFLNAGVSEAVRDTLPLPVKLSSTTGDINITAGDLNVQLDHTGVNYDSTRVGDGTNLLVINPDGSINANFSYEDVLGKYAISRDDTTDPTKEYYGFVDTSGGWYILNIDKTATTSNYRYAKGASNFSTNWTNKASLSYDEFNNLTW